jgi:O-antigen/teichoic acid export membrane protein
MALAPELIYTFAGEAFKPGIVTMQIMSVLPIVIGFGHLLSFQLLIPFGQNKAVFVSMLIGLAVSIAANLILIPLFLDKGAAISAVITETLVCAAYYYHLSAENKFKIHYSLLYQTFISSLVFVPIIAGIRMAFDNPIVICILSIFTCVAAYSILQFLVFKNVEVLKLFIQKRTQT